MMFAGKFTFSFENILFLSVVKFVGWCRPIYHLCNVKPMTLNITKELGNWMGSSRHCINAKDACSHLTLNHGVAHPRIGSKWRRSIK